MTAWLALLLDAALLAVLAPALEALVRQAAARFHGDTASAVSQPWRDLVKHWRKPSQLPHDASFVFSSTPGIALGTAVSAALLVPSFMLGMGMAASADLVVVVGLLALSRLAPALAAYDVGTPYATLAGARVATARLRAEPVLLLVALTAFMLSGSTNLDVMALRDGAAGLRVPGALAALAVVAVVAQEPPAPSMFSGRHLALVIAAAQVRRVAGLSLAALLGLPFGLATEHAGLGAWVLGVACWVLKLGIFGVLAAALPHHRAVLPAAALLTLIAAALLFGQQRV